jgi:acetyltransferase-like isoleucine patch superfamily enzyme
MSEGNSYITPDPTILTDEGLEPCSFVKLDKYSATAQNVRFYQVDNHPCVKDRKLVSTFEYAFLGTRGHDGYYKEGIVVQSDVWIGEFATIMGGVTIGYGAIVGAFSVVDNDVPPYAVVHGNRATLRGYRFTPKQIEALLRIKWWDWSRDDIVARSSDMLDINSFIQKYDKNERI